MACPILLMLSSLAWRRAAGVVERLLLEEAPGASPPLDRNSWLLTRSCCSVVKIVRSARAAATRRRSDWHDRRSSAQAVAAGEASTTRNPSVAYRLDLLGVKHAVRLAV